MMLPLYLAGRQLSRPCSRPHTLAAEGAWGYCGQLPAAAELSLAGWAAEPRRFSARKHPTFGGGRKGWPPGGARSRIPVVPHPRGLVRGRERPSWLPQVRSPPSMPSKPFGKLRGVRSAPAAALTHRGCWRRARRRRGALSAGGGRGRLSRAMPSPHCPPWLLPAERPAPSARPGCPCSLRPPGACSAAGGCAGRAGLIHRRRRGARRQRGGRGRPGVPGPRCHPAERGGGAANGESSGNFQAVAAAGEVAPLSLRRLRPVAPSAPQERPWQPQQPPEQELPSPPAAPHAAPHPRPEAAPRGFGLPRWSATRARRAGDSSSRSRLHQGNLRGGIPDPPPPCPAPPLAPLSQSLSLPLCRGAIRNQAALV